MSAEVQRVKKYRVNRVSMPYGGDSFMTFTLNHGGMSRMMAICFDPSELFEAEVVDLIMRRIFTVFEETTRKLEFMEIADAQARTEDPNMRDKILGLHIGRDADDTILLSPSHIVHAEECGWLMEET